MYGLGAILGTASLAGCAGRSGVRADGGTPTPAKLGQPPPSGLLSSAALSVSSTPVGTIGPAFAGLSYEKDSFAVPRFSPENAELIGLFRRLGRSQLRIGGNSVDSTHWSANGPGRRHGEVAPADIDALAGFLEGCDWSVLYGVNLATSSPADAAAEVAYVSRRLGARLCGIEIGNEPDLYRGQYFPHWAVSDFELRWQQFRDAITQSAPQVVVTGPSNSTNIDSWTVPFGAYAAGQITQLTQHYYRGNGRSPGVTGEALISRDETLLSSLQELNRVAGSIGAPFRLTETNSYFNGGAPGVSNSYASALWVVDHLFNIALGGGVGANLHGGNDGPGYTPIADRNGTVIGVRPEYYGMLLFTLAGEGSLLDSDLSAGELDVSAYALERADGALAVVVVNKDAVHNVALRIDCGRSVRSATLVAMSGPSLAATSGVQIQGAAVAANGNFAPQSPYQLPVSGGQLSSYVGPRTAALIVAA
jgi:hypothetical protein